MDDNVIEAFLCLGACAWLVWRVFRWENRLGPVRWKRPVVERGKRRYRDWEDDEDD